VDNSPIPQRGIRKGLKMNRIESGERKAFVVISRTQTKVWKGDFSSTSVPQTIYERSAFPSSFTGRRFNPRQMQQRLFDKITANLDSDYSQRISRSLRGAEEVYIVGRGKRKNAILNQFMNHLAKSQHRGTTKIHSVSNVDASGLSKRELMALARMMEENIYAA